ncbi:MAG: hypothetical protein LBP19_05140 [Treponema sp.]|nr:hypothetical protein [Treponema sp.]
MMETTRVIEPGFTLEQFIASMQEIRKTHEEIAQRFKDTERLVKETDNIVKETALQMKETDKRFAETDKRFAETDKRFEETERLVKETTLQIKETNKKFGELNNRFGEIVEYMVIPNLAAKFSELGFEFLKAHGADIVDRKHNIFLEIDALLENDDMVMIVEIKSKVQTKDIDEHIERMKKMRRYADFRGDARKYFAGMAGVVFSDSAKNYALKNGLYVIEPSGETFDITAPTGEYHPRVWYMTQALPE